MNTNNAYAPSFQNFLDCTDEKLVFFNSLKTLIVREKIHSILDIGAGNGDLSVPLSKLVPEYLAIEPVKKHADNLKENRIKVIESFFPCEIKTIFDMVLSSHSLPGNKESFQPFIEKAINLINPRGLMVIITYDDQESEWSSMVHACDLPWIGSHVGRITSLTEFVKSLQRKTEISEIITSVASSDFERFIRALAFVYSDGNPEKTDLFVSSPAIRSYLSSKYKLPNENFSFPFVHYLITIRND